MKMALKRTAQVAVISGVMMTVAGCGSDGPGGIFDLPTTYSCDLDMDISGTEVNENINFFSSSRSNNCSLVRVSNGVYTVTYPSASSTVTVAITVNDLVDGQSSFSDHAASVKITHKADGRVWETGSTACTVRVTVFDTSDSYREGISAYSGTCPANAAMPDTATGATGPLSIGNNFDFDDLSYFN